jgi:molybdopterin-guanine dinucleotide biosynthesis protein A
VGQVKEESFSGAVLAGGHSRRFGSDKAVAQYRGRPLIHHVLGSLAQAQQLFVIANQPIPFVTVPVYCDLIKTGSPISGLHSALTSAIHPWVAVAACDLPNLSTTFWRFLYNLKGSGQAVVVRHKNGRLEPLAALYNREVLPTVETKLRTRQLSLQRLIADLDTRYVPSQTLAANELFKNINRPEDLSSMDPPV